MADASIVVEDLFAEHLDGPALQRFVTRTFGAAIAASVAWAEPAQTVRFEVAQMLSRHGLIDAALFVALYRERVMEWSPVRDAAARAGTALPPEAPKEARAPIPRPDQVSVRIDVPSLPTEQLPGLLAAVRGYAKEARLTVDAVRPGSVILVLGGPRHALARVIEAGPSTLAEILSLPVAWIQWGDVGEPAWRRILRRLGLPGLLALVGLGVAGTGTAWWLSGAGSPPLDVSPVERPPAELTPTEHPPTEGTPTEGTPTEGTPTEGTPTEGTPTEPIPEDETPIDPEDGGTAPVDLHPPANHPPVADAGGPYRGQPAVSRGPMTHAMHTTRRGLTEVHFDGSLSSDPDGDALAWAWDFGDGAGTATEPKPVYKYARSGRYTATLRVTDPAGASVTDTAKVLVPNQSPYVTSINPSPCKPSPRLPVNMEVHAADADGVVTAFAWDFGDGATATGNPVIHTFAAAAPYTVRVTVTDDDGATTAAAPLTCNVR